MAPRQENISLSSPTISTDEWLERKKKVDGAEELWRIHNKLYDFTLWSRVHPGGKFWLNITRGTDITEAFETHHSPDKVQSMLEKFYMREAASPRNYTATFHPNGFFKTFKQLVSEKNLISESQSSWKSTLIADSLAVLVFFTGVLAVNYGNVWTLLSGNFLGVLATSAHDFLHKKDTWRAYYFNLSMMSSREWRIRHVLSHHQYRNTFLDLDASAVDPFSGLFPLKQKNWFFYSLKFMLRLFYYAVSAHLQFLKRFLDVFLSRKLQFHPEELVQWTFLLFLYICGRQQPWDTFITWNLIILCASFVFFQLRAIKFSFQSQIKRDEKDSRSDQDFGTTQLFITGTHPKESISSLFGFLNSYQNNALHYLCPTIDSTSLSQFLPIFNKACSQLGIRYTTKNTGILKEMFDGQPKGHLFFS